jgi:hypothetical protein
MNEIANAVGRAACGVIWGFVPRCQTGQSVATIGYATIALIVIVAVIAVVSRRA